MKADSYTKHSHENYFVIDLLQWENLVVQLKAFVRGVGIIFREKCVIKAR